MFYLNKDTELTTELLYKLINKYRLNNLPQLKEWGNYYKGEHTAILRKSYQDANKPCNRIVTNFCKIVSDTYNGYICGKPVSYTSNQDIEDVQEVINYNDSAAQDISFLSNALNYGVAYELYWLDKYAQVRYSQVNPMQALAIYDNTLECELLYFVRWYEADNTDDSNTYFVEVYSADTITTYKANGFGGMLEFVKEETHYFNTVPVSVFYLNDQEESIFNSILTLNDAYNELQSAEIDDFSAWVDAYLVFSGGSIDLSQATEMRQKRIMALPEGVTASFLTKNANDTQIVNMLDNIKKNIFKVTACPDMADETFLAQSGTALAYKLVGFENVASAIVARFTKALQRRIEVICAVLNLKASDAIWRDIHINFVRNLPVNIAETVQLVNGLHGIVSDKTLLAQLPFVNDVDAELEALQAQKQANMELYGFGDMGTQEDNEE